MILARSPVLCNPESGVRDFKFVRTPVLLIAESGAIDLGIRSPDSLNAESGLGGVSRGLGVTLSATIIIFTNIKFCAKIIARALAGMGGAGDGGCRCAPRSWKPNATEINYI